MSDRNSYIGSSDCAAILNVSPWKTPYVLYMEKTGQYQEIIDPKKQRILNRGKRWEKIVIDMAIDELQDQGHEVEVIALNSRHLLGQYDFISAEIDAEIMMDGEIVNLEAKTVSPWAIKDWGDEDSGSPPIYYLAQVQHGLMVTGRRKTILAALSGFDDRPMIWHIERCEETINGILAKELEFWNRIVQQNPPDPISMIDLEIAFPVDNGKTIEATQDHVVLCENIKQMEFESKLLDKNIEDESTRLKLLIGDAAIVKLEGKKLVTWTNNKDSKKTDHKSALDEICEEFDLDQKQVKKILDNHTKIQPGARVLRIK